MKTNDEKKEVPSFEDLVFENRNKEYGAYEIRKKYDLTLIWAILISAFCVSATVITPFFITPSRPVKIITPKQGTEITYISTLMPVEVPKTDLPRSVGPKAIRLDYSKVQVVDTVPLDGTKGIPITQDYTSTEPGDSSTNGIPEPPSDGIVPDLNKVENPWGITEQPFFGTGGKNEFRDWIAKKLIYPQEPLSNGVQGRVFVEFIIEKDGSLSNVTAIKAIDPDLGKEAVRVVSSSPNWTPGKQQGIPVRVRFTFPITFKLDQ